MSTQCYNLCIGLLEIQLASYCNSSGLNSVTLRNELIDNLKPFIQDFAHLVDKQYLGKLPRGISQYCNYANTEEVYYAFVDSIVSQLLKKMLSQLESLAPSNFRQKYPNAGNTYCIGEGPENNEVDQIVKAIEAKFKTYNNNEKDGGMGILVVKSEPHFFNIFTSNIPLKYAAKIVDRLNAHSIENTYFNKVLIIGEAYKKDQIYIYKSENELWELRQIVH